MKVYEDYFKSSTNVCNIYWRKFIPEDENVKAVVVMHHGMAEYSERYVDFFEFLTSNGVAVYMHDMANHGKSNQVPEETGYFGDKDGYVGLIEDMKILFDKAKEDYPDKKIIICGHSMGSFIARCFTARYPDAGFSGAVYIGTGGSNPAAPIGDMLSKLICKSKGTKYKSKMLDSLTFGSYNNKFEKRTSFDWLSTNVESNDKYIADDMCGFLFSAAGMNDLIKLNVESNSKEWYQKVPKDLPILLISGEMDPVSSYGKGIKEIYEKLKESSHTDVTMKLYKGMRHEILNEIGKEEVYNDYAEFINKKII